MTITLCIIASLLSGLLAAWVEYKYVCEEYLDTSLFLVLFFMAAGPVGLLVVLAHLPGIMSVLTVFKAKEPK